MREADVILNGARALQYLVPGVSHPEDTWTFAGPSNVPQLKEFAKRTKEKLGMLWNPGRETFGRIDTGLGVLRKKGKVDVYTQ
ncbi:hypothetical protein LTR96_011759 [Exophiala xenobiotica]|nr:hypothetical protein LTR92_011501 [Exophiala xenobiotica]KAK5217598.1 hypothetical protein LTR47_011852 [Exophiala xenobiotica]KAK5242573.1 hypothetical protein LTS06_011434 [Exophiala xenobiotica]KAK5262742.1 hypothetical protein LTR96_011759 [Exophiala xenobiotica]KAK5280013.1 hypothetical protein LTR40_006973 [Exophiala xenobiotica]